MKEEAKRTKTAYEFWLQSKSPLPFCEWQIPAELQQRLEEEFKDKDKSS